MAPIFYGYKCHFVNSKSNFTHVSYRVTLKKRVKRKTFLFSKNRYNLVKNLGHVTVVRVQVIVEDG